MRPKNFSLYIVPTDYKKGATVVVETVMTSRGIKISKWESNKEIDPEFGEALNYALGQVRALPQKHNQFWCGILISQWLAQATIKYGKPVNLIGADKEEEKEEEQ